MPPVDAAKISEKALWELLLLEAAFPSGWISTRILEVSQEHVSGAQLPSGMTSKLHRAPSPLCRTKAAREGEGEQFAVCAHLFLQLLGHFALLHFLNSSPPPHPPQPHLSCREGNIWQCSDFAFHFNFFSYGEHRELQSHKHEIGYDKGRTPAIVRSQVFTASLRAPSAGINICIFFPVLNLFQKNQAYYCHFNNSSAFANLIEFQFKCSSFHVTSSTIRNILYWLKFMNKH